MKRTDIIFPPLSRDIQSPEERTFTELILLMEMITSLTDNVEEYTKPPDEDSYLHMSAVYRDLKRWHETLPDSLQWTEANAGVASFGFFLLQ